MKKIKEKEDKVEEKPLLEGEKKEEEKVEDFSDLIKLAKLMDKSIEELKDECCLFELKKLMSNMGNVILSGNVKENDIERVLLNSYALEMGEVLVSPMYLQWVRKVVEKHQLERLNVNAMIDFPFGESLLKTKIVDAKNCIKNGVDGITVVVPKVLLSNDKEDKKILKKTIKKVARLSKNSGIAIPMNEVEVKDIEPLIKVADKTKIKYITFMFGEASVNEVKEKMGVIKSYKSKKKIKILGNVNSGELLVELFKLKLDCILTPSLDNIGKELVNRFNVKSLNLL